MIKTFLYLIFTTILAIVSRIGIALFIYNL